MGDLPLIGAGCRVIDGPLNGVFVGPFHTGGTFEGILRGALVDRGVGTFAGDAENGMFVGVGAEGGNSDGVSGRSGPLVGARAGARGEIDGIKSERLT
jgi:hypothetical protein